MGLKLTTLGSRVASSSDWANQVPPNLPILNAMIFTKFIELCSHDRNPVSEYFHYPSKIPSAYLQLILVLPTALGIH